MSTQKKVELIIEQRQAEAVKKGLTKDLKKIARYLGHELIGDGGEEGIYCDFQSGPQNYSEEDEIPVFEEEFGTVIGYHIDTLSSGVDLQILYLLKDDSIKVQYKGNKVYEDSSNNLLRYLPSEEWEQYVKLLLKKVPKQVKLHEAKEAEKQQSINKFKISKVLEYLSSYWGIGK